MGNRKISPDLKECALRLWNAGWDIEDIHNALGVSRARIYRWEAVCRVWHRSGSNLNSDTIL
jgi:hypothetical protein